MGISEWRLNVYKECNSGFYERHECYFYFVNRWLKVGTGGNMSVSEWRIKVFDEHVENRASSFHLLVFREWFFYAEC